MGDPQETWGWIPNKVIRKHNLGCLRYDHPAVWECLLYAESLIRGTLLELMKL